MAETTTRELLDAGELVGAARREAAYARTGGYTTTAELLVKLADTVEDGVSAEDFNAACDQKRGWRDRARAAEAVLREITNLWPASTATAIATAHLEKVGSDALEPRPERELPKVDIDLLVHGKTERVARVYVDANDLALWLSTLLRDAPAGEQWILGRIRDEMLAAARSREGSERIR